MKLGKHQITGRNQHLAQSQLCGIRALGNRPDGLVLLAVDDTPPGVIAVGKNNCDLWVLGHDDGEVVWCFQRQFIMGSRTETILPTIWARKAWKVSWVAMVQGLWLRVTACLFVDDGCCDGRSSELRNAKQFGKLYVNVGGRF
jgi:hypothetical protein